MSLLLVVVLSPLWVAALPVQPAFAYSEETDWGETYGSSASNHGDRTTIDVSETFPPVNEEDAGIFEDATSDGPKFGRVAIGDSCTDWAAAGLASRPLVCLPLVAAEAMPAVTLADVQSFAPAASALTGEPDGWGLKGRATNFISPASVETRTGVLLGRPVEVRFSPEQWAWDFGDGETLESDSGGATWEHLGQARFTPTATSHAYLSRGTYLAKVVVEYDVAYRFEGQAWRPVAGTLEIPSAARDLRVFVGSTVLVNGDCSSQSTSC